MDENSFEEKKIAALLKLTEGQPSNKTTVNSGKTYGEPCGDHYKYGTRLYAGIDNSIESGNSFFAAGMMFDRNLNTVDTTKCYIKQPVTTEQPATTEQKLATIFYDSNSQYTEDINQQNLATILLWYGDTDNSKPEYEGHHGRLDPELLYASFGQVQPRDGF